MSPILAQLPDWSNTLVNAGALGICLLFFMWRDVKREEREEKRNVERDNAVKDLTSAMNHLTRAITLEVLTRPNVVKRAQDEAREISEAIGERQ